jgi:phage pi2 protein 07
MSHDKFYGELLDSDHMDHVCTTMVDTWSGKDLDQRLANSLAELVESDLINPANVWLEKQDKSIQAKYPGNEQARQELALRTDAAALLQFLERAEEVRYQLKCNLYLMPEYVNMLRGAWGGMQGVFASTIQYLIPPAEAHQRYRNEQSRKAQLPRGRINTDGEQTSISDIIKEIAWDEDSMGDYFPARELWPQLFAKLDALGLDPKETDDAYHFTGGQIKLASFTVMLSRTRAQP